jgi:hypothetical protein
VGGESEPTEQEGKQQYKKDQTHEVTSICPCATILPVAVRTVPGAIYTAESTRGCLSAVAKCRWEFSANSTHQSESPMLIIETMLEPSHHINGGATAVADWKISTSEYVAAGIARW